MIFHKDMTIEEVLYCDDDVLEVFQKHGLPCSSCSGAASETLEIAARVHGCSLMELLMDLNNI